MNNKKWSNILTILGLLLIAAALFLTASNLFEQRRAGDDAADALQELEQLIPPVPQTEEAPDYVLDPNMEMPVKTVDGIDYIGKIEIPVTDMELPIISEWYYPNLKIAPCRYEGSAYSDNLIIAGHNYNTHFGPIRNLIYGDTVIFTDANGNIFKYKVVEIETLKSTAVKELSSGDWDLTLFTCTKGAAARVAVRCIRI